MAVRSEALETEAARRPPPDPMRFAANKRPLPRTWSHLPGAGGLVAEADIYPHPRGRLAAKLLVFDRQPALRAFWRKTLGKLHVEGLGRHCLGAVNAMCHERIPPRGPSTLCGDPRYFCVIGLIVGHLSMEIITHESVHAGFAYAKRVGRNVWGKVGDFDEEQIAYPAGTIAGSINRVLHAKGLYVTPA
jgi:hypothetical protein